MRKGIGGLAACTAAVLLLPWGHIYASSTPDSPHADLDACAIVRELAGDVVDKDLEHGISERNEIERRRFPSVARSFCELEERRTLGDVIAASISVTVTTFSDPRVSHQRLDAFQLRWSARNNVVRNIPGEQVADIGTATFAYWRMFGDEAGFIRHFLIDCHNAAVVIRFEPLDSRIEPIVESLSDLAERAVDAQRHALPPCDDPATLVRRLNSAGGLGESGDVNRAVEELRSLLDEALRIYGPSHHDTLVIRNNLGHWLVEQGMYEEALDHLGIVVESRMLTSGPEHSETLIARNNYASALGEMGRVEDAIEEFEDLVADRDRLLGRRHYDSMLSLQNLVHWLIQAKDHEAAVVRLGDLIDRFDHQDMPDAINARYLLATQLAALNQPSAREVAESALADAVRVLGDGHRLTTEIRDLVGDHR